MSAPRVVLVRPRNAGNLLAIARAMKAFGLREWVAVSSADHLARVLEVARRRFPDDVGALASLRRVASLEEAVRGCEVAVGTTPRALPAKPRMTPRELALYSAHSDATWALVFGAETNGLNDDDLKSCDALAFIPADDAQPSVNLSQAVVVFAYELHAASATPPGLVDVRALRALRETVATAVRAHGMARRAADELVAPLVRAGLRRDEGAAHEAVWSTWRRR